MNLITMGFTTQESHVAFLKETFRLAETSAGAGIRDGVLIAVVDRLVEVDVEIRWDKMQVIIS